MLIAIGARYEQMLRCRRVPGNPDKAAITGQVARARRGQKIVMPLPARPGNIYGRGRYDSVLLAGSRQVPGCFVDPKLLTDRQHAEVSEQLAEIFDTEAFEIYTQLASRNKRRFVWVQREITNAQAKAVRALKNRAVGIEYEWRREYPNGGLAGTVIGFTNKNNESGGGLHTMLNRVLTPKDGKYVLKGDAMRRPFGVMAKLSVSPSDGRNAYLSLDVNIQQFLQHAVSESVQRYGAKWGTGVVVNPWTGDILAMCSAPTYDPNNYSRVPAEQMLNRAICCPFEPGSIYKPIIAAAAVQNNILNYQSRIYCENGVYHARRGGRISDHGHRYGMMSLWDIVVKSSNIGMAKVGEKLGNRNLWRLSRQWGFGEKTNVGLPGETGGIIRPLNRWDGYSLRRIPFGQEISTSALQLTMAFSAFANGGVLMRPRLVQTITDAHGRVVYQNPPARVRRVLSADVARQSLSVLQDVVERGTGKKCRLKNYTSWGKTGTAQIPGPQGYTDGAYTGSFIGGAPASNPAVVCLISIYWPDRHKGYYGGTVAAPYVKDVLQKTLTYLQVTPDRPEGQMAIRPR